MNKLSLRYCAYVRSVVADNIPSILKLFHNLRQGSLIFSSILFFLLSSTILLEAQTKKVLFVGNSYTLNNNLPGIVANFASSVGDGIIQSSSAIPDYTLKLHSTNTTTLGLIRQGGWDFVVLQEYSQNPSEPLTWVEANVYPYATYLDQEINKYNPGAETMFYMTWGRRDGDLARCPRLPEVCTYIGMDDLTRQRYMYMAQANQAVVSPVGAVWRYIRTNYPSIELYVEDGSHPSAAGSYAAACCFYAAIFRKDPALSSYNYTLDPTVASNIRKAAREVVFKNLLTWYIGAYDKQSISITVNSGTGGTISPGSTQNVKYGSNMTFNITPLDGYRISDVKVDNSSVGQVSVYRFTNIISNHTITATFSQLSYTLTTNAGQNGKITPGGPVTVNYGGKQTFSIRPDNGFSISDVKADNSSIGAVSEYTFFNVTSNHTLSATFKSIVLNIKSSSGKGGHINPSGTTSITYGKSQKYDISPDKGYKIKDVLVDNISNGAITSYSFSNVIADHTIYAEFTPITFTVTGMAGEGGAMNPSGRINVNYGDDLKIILLPDYGYRVSDVIVGDDHIDAASNEVILYDITGDYNISATFREISKYNMVARAGKEGSITPSGDTLVYEGSDATYKITPKAGFRVSKVYIDSLVLGPLEEYTFREISGDHTILVSFTSSVKVEISPNPFTDDLRVFIRSPFDRQYKIVLLTPGNSIVFASEEVPSNTLNVFRPAVPPGFYILGVYLKNERVASAPIIRR